MIKNDACHAGSLSDIFNILERCKVAQSQLTKFSSCELCASLTRNHVLRRSLQCVLCTTAAHGSVQWSHIPVHHTGPLGNHGISVTEVAEAAALIGVSPAAAVPSPPAITSVQRIEARSSGLLQPQVASKIVDLQSVALFPICGNNQLPQQLVYHACVPPPLLKSSQRSWKSLRSIQLIRSQRRACKK